LKEVHGFSVSAVSGRWIGLKSRICSRFAGWVCYAEDGVDAIEGLGFGHGFSFASAIFVAMRLWQEWDAWSFFVGEGEHNQILHFVQDDNFVAIEPVPLR
jgi:hypothetical protein